MLPDMMLRVRVDKSSIQLSSISNNVIHLIGLSEQLYIEDFNKQIAKYKHRGKDDRLLLSKVNCHQHGQQNPIKNLKFKINANKQHIQFAGLSTNFYSVRSLLIDNQMSRSESHTPLSGHRKLYSNGPAYEPSSMFQPYTQIRPRHDKNLEGSIKSYNAVEGSLRGSVASLYSGVSAPSRKSQKSIISNYPQMLSKQPQKSQYSTPYDIQPQSRSQAPQVQPRPQPAPQPEKKQKANYYIDQDYFYSSQFKRNFVKGMLALAKNKDIEDMSLLLKQVAPTIMVKPNDTSIWVSAFLIIFKIEHQLRRIKNTEENIVQLIEDHLIQFMIKNPNFKKARLLKIIIYLFKELPVHKPKIIQWFQQFVRKNKDRLHNIDLSKYADIYSINQCHIDYSVISKSSVVKSKQMDKQKQRQRQKERRLERQREKEREKQKQKMRMERDQQRQRQRERQTQIQKQKQRQRQKQKQMDDKQRKQKEQPNTKLSQKQLEIQQQNEIIQNMMQPVQQQQKPTNMNQAYKNEKSMNSIIQKKVKNKQKNYVEDTMPNGGNDKNQIKDNKIKESNQQQNKADAKSDAKSDILHENKIANSIEDKAKQDKKVDIINLADKNMEKLNEAGPNKKAVGKAQQQKMSLQEMISRRIQSSLPAMATKPKLKGVQSLPKANVSDIVKIQHQIAKQCVTQTRQQKAKNQAQPSQGQHQKQQPHKALKQKIKQIAKDRKDEIKQNNKIKIKKQQAGVDNERCKVSQDDDEDADMDSFVAVSNQEQQQGNNQEQGERANS